MSNRYSVFDSFGPDVSQQLLSRLPLYPGASFEDIPVTHPMMPQDLWIAYEGRSNQDGGLLPQWPTIFWNDLGLATEMCGVDVEDVCAGNFALAYGQEVALWGRATTCKLHIRPRGINHNSNKPDQIQLRHSTSKEFITVNAFLKILARRVKAYFLKHHVQIPGFGHITPARLRIVGTTWVSRGAIMPVLQVVR